MNILPTNFIFWNRDNDPRCQFCNHCTESMAHLLNGCHAEFGNFYSKRHNRIVNYLFDQLKFMDRRYRNYNNKNFESIMPEHREILVMQRKKTRHCSLRPSNQKYWYCGNYNLLRFVLWTSFKWETWEISSFVECSWKSWF